MVVPASEAGWRRYTLGAVIGGITPVTSCLLMDAVSEGEALLGPGAGAVQGKHVLVQVPS